MTDLREGAVIFFGSKGAKEEGLYTRHCSSGAQLYIFCKVCMQIEYVATDYPTSLLSPLWLFLKRHIDN